MSRTLKAAALLALAVLTACSTQTKLREMERLSMRAELSLPQKEAALPEMKAADLPERDTFTVMDGGKEMIIMDAVMDEDGEMVAHDVIRPVTVTARFRNVAERHGRVSIQFQITVPAAMQDSRWQLRFHPDMFILEDSVRLESVYITGKDYRKAQLRGYQQYERFLSRIVSDTTRFINVWQLELFIRRNIPALYSFKRDTSRVSDEQFASVYGVTEREAVEHYTNRIAERWNRRRLARRDRMFRKYVKVPIEHEGLRLDTVIQNADGDFIYNYTQTIATRPKLRKVGIVVSGETYENEKMIYPIPRSEELTFYISSLSAFVDGTERYRTRVVERRAEANTACYIDFALGSAEVDGTLGRNAEETGRIRKNLASLMENEEYDLDSIVVTASASPEGREAFNRRLSRKRSASISEHFGRWMESHADSLDRERGMLLDEDGNRIVESRPEIRFISRSDGENWRMLDRLVEQDTVLSAQEKERYRTLSAVRDPDDRERRMQDDGSYRYMREKLYPKLRTVKFGFHLHRKGMVKDTVHTTELDSAYMAGVQAIRDRDYRHAIELLRPYNDYNTAIAYVSLDYNASAMAILETLERTAQVEYMLAILHSRKGDAREAVECYLSACRKDRSYVHRGNLDPEISMLVSRYGLDRLLGEE